MNRRQRRLMEKQLGLHKHYKKMSLDKWREKVKSNLENGKTLMEKHNNDLEASLQEQDDAKESDIVLHTAEQIAKNENIPLIDAMVKAQNG